MKYQDAYSFDLERSVSASEAAQKFLDGEIKDARAFECRAANCSAELTLVNAGKTEQEIAAPYHFRVPKGRQPHSEECNHGGPSDEESIKEREEEKRQRALKSDVNDCHVRFSSASRPRGGPVIERPERDPRDDDDEKTEEIGNDDHMRSMREIVDRFAAMDIERRRHYKLHFPTRTEIMEDAFYWADLEDNFPAPLNINLIYAGIAYLHMHQPKEGHFRVEYHWNVEAPGHSAPAYGSKRKPYFDVPFSELRDSEFKSYFSEILGLNTVSADKALWVDAFIYGRPRADETNRLHFHFQDLSKIHLIPQGHRPQSIVPYMHKKGEKRRSHPFLDTEFDPFGGD